MISTHRGLYLVDIKENVEHVRLQELSTGYYYGLAVYDDYVLAARRIDPWSSKVSPTAFELWSRHGLCLGMSNLDGNDIIDCHQIVLGPHGLYICNVGRNSLEIRDPFTYEKKIVLRFCKGGAPGGLLLNSVCPDGDDVYLLFHNRDVTQSFVQSYTHVGDDLVLNYRIPVDVEGAHNLLYRDGRLYYNASDVGAVHALSPGDFDAEDWATKGRAQVQHAVLDSDWHTKGMAVVGDTLVVGLSESGELDHRFVSESHIAFLPLPNLNDAIGNKLVHPTNGFIGNINEIRVV